MKKLILSVVIVFMSLLAIIIFYAFDRDLSDNKMSENLSGNKEKTKMQDKYYIPLAFQKGEYGLSDLKNAGGEMLEIGYTDGPGIIEYSIPGSYHRPRIYGIPHYVLENSIKANYSDDGKLKTITVNNSKNENLLVYIRYDSEEEAKQEIRNFAIENARIITEQLVQSREKAARLFTEYYYDGEIMDYHAYIGTEEQKQKIKQKYPDDDSVVDNGGDYIIYSEDYTNLIYGDNNKLGTMVVCADTDSSETNFPDYAANIMNEYIRENAVDKLDKTDDFKFITGWYD